MIEQTEPTEPMPEPGLPPNQRRTTLLIFLSILAITVLGYLFFASQTAAQRPLKPPRNTATPNVIAINNQPVVVTFTQLNEDPFALVNRTVRVTGSFTPLDTPACDTVRSGPRIKWALIAEELQLDARGFEPIMRLVPPGTNMTIEGIWRLYEGPHGCGKEPERTTLWYLEVTQIIQPNPLPLLNGTAVPLGSIATPTFAPTTPTVELVGTPLPTAATDGGEQQPTPVPTATDSSIPTATVTLPPTSAVTPSPSPTMTPTPNATASPTATPLSGASPTTSPTPGSTEPTSTPPNEESPTNTPPPPIATATPGSGYPGDMPTNTPPPTTYP